jgi:hypothetical protein
VELSEVSSRNAQDQLMLTTGFSVQPAGVEGTQIQYEFDTMPGNQPSSNSNTVFIWQTSDPENIPSSSPQNSKGVAVDQPNGSDVFTGLTVTSEAYLLGYAVGPDVKNVCALVFVPAESAGKDPMPLQPTISALPGSTSVAFDYRMPGGTAPQTDGDWAGLWQGETEAVLYDMPPTWFVPIPQDDPQGAGAFENVTIRRGSQYTIGYFKGGYDSKTPKQTTLACSVTFRG